MKNNHYYIYITESERIQIIQSLIKLRNTLIEQGKYTDWIIVNNLDTKVRKLTG